MNKAKVDSIVALYKEGKLPRYDQALKMLKSINTVKSEKTDQAYKSMIDKYSDAPIYQEKMAKVVKTRVAHKTVKKERDQGITYIEITIEHKSLSTIKINMNLTHVSSIDEPINDVKPVFKREIAKLMETHNAAKLSKKSLKVLLGVNLDVGRMNPDWSSESGVYANIDNSKIIENLYVHTQSTKTISTIGKIGNVIDELSLDLIEAVTTISKAGSSWWIEKIHFFYADCFTIKPARGSS